MTLSTLCPASTATDQGDVLIDQHDPTGRVSTEIHRAIACELKGEDWPMFQGEDAGENEELVGRAVSWFKENIVKFGGDEVEASFEAALTSTILTRVVQVTISGTLDVIYRQPLRSVIADWKNTYRDDDYESQLLTYAWLEFQARPEIVEVEIFTVYLRLRVTDHKIVSRSWVESWMREHIQNNILHPEIYRPGEHCGKCNRFAMCAALTAMNRRTIAELTESPAGEYLNRETGAELWSRVRLLEASIQHFRDFMKESVARDGAIALPNGKELRQIPQNKVTVLPYQAWGILEEEFTETELAEILRVPKGALEDAIGAKAPKGMKGKEQKRLLERLTAAGAVSIEKKFIVKELNPKEVEHVAPSSK